MGDNKERSIKKLFLPKNFSIFLGIVVFLLLLLFSSVTDVFSRIETDVLDLHFEIKSGKTRIYKEVTVIEETINPRVSNDIVIVGIDSGTLETFGRWPFPREIHGNLIKSFSRIKEQNQRENALYMDIFFSEPDSNTDQDRQLKEAMEENGRVFLENILSVSPPGYDSRDSTERMDALNHNGVITILSGDVSKLFTYYSSETPITELGEVSRGYGHANFSADWDDIYRHQQLIARYSLNQGTVRLDHLEASQKAMAGERLAWQTREGEWIDVDLPLSDNVIEHLKADMEKRAPSRSEDTDNDRVPDNTYFELVRYKDQFIPAVTLSIAANYFNTPLEEIEVVLGEYILFPNPRVYNKATDELEPYRVLTQFAQYDEVEVFNEELGEKVKETVLVKNEVYKNVPEIRIPIDEKGQMLINYMGNRSSSARDGYKTFSVYPYSTYAKRVPGEDPARWPRTKAVGNKIVMVGGFFQGTDEKTTPFGLMYGVEVHANALNTIIMDNFIIPVPSWVNLVVLLTMILLISLYSSRINTLLSFLLTIILIALYFLLVNYVFFEERNILINFATPAIGGFLTFLVIIVYRVVAGESDKKRIKSMFGKYVSPAVVEQMMISPPELGGVDMDITIFFSDIRSFTTLSESMSPQELVKLLNDYLTSMTDCLIEYDGTLDKYIGDAIMGFWGAPLPQDNHAVLACKSALRQLELLELLNEQAEPNKRIQIGIGMNSGNSTVGNMGSQGRMNFTVMGDNVNLASRLEGITKQYRTKIVISQTTMEGIKHDPLFITRELDDIRVKGKLKPVKIFELVGYDGDLSLMKESKGNGKG